MHKVSIIIPLYNVEEYLETTVRSALAQTYTDIGIILVDDGSTDKSGAICDSLAAQDPRIRVIHKPNGGVSDSRNTGLDAADGEYIFFLDSDDIIAPDTIETLLGACEQGADLAIAGYVRFKNEPRTIHAKGESFEFFDGKEATRRMLYNQGYTHGLWNKLYLASLWDGIRFRVGHLYEDLDTAFKVVPRAEKAAYIPRPLYQYRVHTGSIMRSRITEENIDLLDISDRVTCEVISLYPDLEEYALDLKARTYLKLMKNILDTDFNAHPAAQERITGYIRSQRQALLSSSVVKTVDKIKVRTLCIGKHLFYIAYKIGDIKNKNM